MSNYVMTFRGARDRVPTPEAEAEWSAWFAQIGPSIVDFGNRVARATSVGSQTSQTVLSGYMVITADDLESAVTVANGCPGLHHGGGVEVGEIIDTP